jgi:hypothetical protein
MHYYHVNFSGGFKRRKLEVLLCCTSGFSRSTGAVTLLSEWLPEILLLHELRKRFGRRLLQVFLRRLWWSLKHDLSVQKAANFLISISIINILHWFSNVSRSLIQIAIPVKVNSVCFNNGFCFPPPPPPWTRRWMASVITIACLQLI